MILSHLALSVGQKIKMTDSQTLALINGWANANHRTICGNELWKDLLSIYTFAVTASQPVLVLPHQIERIAGAKYDSFNLLPVDQVFLFITDPTVWDRIGTATRFAEMPSVGTRVNPTAEMLRLVSSSAGDTTTKVSVVGELAGEEMRETVTLNGTTPVQTSNAYDVVYTLAKETTAGNLSVTGVTSSAALLTLRSDESHRRHIRLRLLETPRDGITLAVLGKRRVPDLLQPSDASPLRRIAQCWEAFTLADAEDWLEQKDDAMKSRNLAMALLGDLKKEEIYQAANVQQLVPYYSDSPGDTPWDYDGSAGKGYL